MEIPEIFSKAVSISISKGINSSLKFLKLSQRKLEDMIEAKNFLLTQENFDIVIDFKPRINQIYLYLTPKEKSKKLLKSLKPSVIEFKSMVVFLGKIKIFEKVFEIRLGAYGYSSSDLARAMSKFR